MSPVFIQDRIATPQGQVGYPGQALDDLNYLWELEDTGDAVVLEDIASGIPMSLKWNARLEVVDFETFHDPTFDRSFGGIAILTFRTAP